MGRREVYNNKNVCLNYLWVLELQVAFLLCCSFHLYFLIILQDEYV